MMGRTFLLIKFVKCGILHFWQKTRTGNLSLPMYLITSHVSKPEFVFFGVLLLVCLFDFFTSRKKCCMIRNTPWFLVVQALMMVVDIRIRIHRKIKEQRICTHIKRGY